MRLEDYAYWEWEYDGLVWGFDPRLPRKHELEQFTIPDDVIQRIVGEHLWKCVRAKRDTLLKECDWVSGEDVPQSIKDTWFPYRQALRDITNQEDPDNIVWPEKPL
jgi:hypothetical protein